MVWLNKIERSTSGQRYLYLLTRKKFVWILVECLLSYLDKTKQFRNSLPKEQRGNLFLALKEPHKAVTSQTISHWIVQVIKDAYAKNESTTSIKVRAHSTRAIGTSWALFKGTSVHEILESADWSLESTFSRFYLRELDVKVLQKLN